MDLILFENIMMGFAVAFYVTAMLTWIWNRKRIRIGWLLWSNMGTTIIFGIILLAAVAFSTMSLPEIYWAGLTLFILMIAVMYMATSFFAARFFGISTYSMLPLTIFKATRERLVSMYGENPATQILYAMGKEIGEQEGRAYIKNGLMDENFVKGWGVSLILGFLGFGKLKVLSFTPRASAELALYDPLEWYRVDEKGGMQGGDMTRGFLAGLGSVVYHDMTCEAVEKRRASVKGVPMCEYALSWYPKLKEGNIKDRSAESKSMPKGG
jgi:predicted hydrocarbon binding protein